MSNLRSLLYVPQSSTIINRYTANGNGDESAYTASSSLQKDGCTLTFARWCQYTPDDNYANGCMCFWCTPTGTTSITFEIWGGGGGGAGGCCCQQGQPSGSGAYARKTVTGTLGGCCYQMCIGNPTDCSATCCGIIGCNTLITGYGLTNFCAEGGFGGKTCCYTFWGNYTCAGNNNGNVRLCYTETDCRCYYGADFGSPGRPGYLWAQCSCYPCNWKAAIPYPGGLVNEGGGYVLLRTQGEACNNEFLRCLSSFGFQFDASNNFAPGMGVSSATSCGGSCCYGLGGSPGMIRITYRQG